MEDKDKIPSPDTQGEPKKVDVIVPFPGEETGKGKGKKGKKKKEEPEEHIQADPVLVTNFFALTKVATQLLSVKAGPVWVFSDAECKAIAEPAARIAERMGAAEISGKYSDMFMLGLALILPIGGRIIFLSNIPPQEGGREDRNSKPDTTEGTQRKAESLGRNSDPKAGTPSNVGNFSDDVLSPIL